MVQFAVFIDRLKRVPLQTDANFQIGRRRRLYEETKSNLKLLLCEYNDTLAKGREIYLPSRKPRVPRINLRCLPKVMNHTEALNVDVSFFRKLKKFFRQSRAIMKRKRQTRAKKRDPKRHKNVNVVQ
ncbi:unnamed protein product [Acanthoscelides obtectus]|nr:unnamed protein product [Acanthoscelides obtectus]CAK1632872.1 hypothetical protein AOBTE_LOCUS7781 [Acanthoscelides obtectus]